MPTNITRAAVALLCLGGLSTTALAGTMETLDFEDVTAGEIPNTATSGSFTLTEQRGGLAPGSVFYTEDDGNIYLGNDVPGNSLVMITATDGSEFVVHGYELTTRGYSNSSVIALAAFHEDDNGRLTLVWATQRHAGAVNGWTTHDSVSKAAVTHFRVNMGPGRTTAPYETLVEGIDNIDMEILGAEVDTDGDGVLDDDDACPDTAGGDYDGDADGCPDDSDGDGVYDEDDNCLDTANADQADADADGIGNACEADSDSDSVIDDEDNCPDDSNPEQGDSDLDGEGDVCDTDDDNDGVLDDNDNCALVDNADQDDLDGDGQGDACDGDDDGDGVEDGDDLCPGTSLTSEIMDNGCSATQYIDHSCNADDSSASGQYMKCVNVTSNALKEAGLITGAQKGGFTSKAAKGK